jgi:hypothetical protein
LLLHGASANRGTFEVGEVSLVERLVGHGFDPWLLDWRGSSLVVDHQTNQLAPGEIFNFNAAAKHDIRPALAEMDKQGVTFPIAALGHCMGSAVLAEAIAMNHITVDEVDRVVLLTLGLFYEAPLDSRIKSEERILDRLRAQKSPQGEFFRINPTIKNAKGDLEVNWPDELEKMYVDWPGRHFHSDQPGDETNDQCKMARHMCNRLSFMYGMPFYHGNLVDEIHGTTSVPAVLQEQFGSIPLHMYLHAARNIRYGHATDYRDPNADHRQFIGPKALQHFRDLKKVTLLTGDRNRLWHRDSIDRMHHWLTRGNLQLREKISKKIVPAYGHQDLLWGKTAPKDVYEKIEAGLS